jgi:diguanylate cyclase (GGDEF)-like protein
MFFQKETRLYITFVVSLSIAIVAILGILITLFVARTDGLIREENLVKARELYRLIVLTRKWNSLLGGVYAVKTPGTVSNPYLPAPDIEARDGRVLTLKNPALMTREISDLSREDGGVWFRITSLKPLNPDNAPDPFERRALASFDRGEGEVFGTDVLAGRKTFRYMAPLFVERDCLPCHGSQGYAVGEVRGGVSVSFDIEDIEARARNNIASTLALGAAAVLALLALTYIFTRKLLAALAATRARIEHMAITDELTQAYNRRFIMARIEEEFQRSRRMGHALSILILDIDLFKAVNDRYGHATGDTVIREVARRIQGTLRAYDVMARYGGEEFIVLLTGTRLPDALALAERIRARLEAEPIEGIRITGSLGAASLGPEDASIEPVLVRADEGLYAAKRGGRNRVSSPETG